MKRNILAAVNAVIVCTISFSLLFVATLVLGISHGPNEQGCGLLPETLIEHSGVQLTNDLVSGSGYTALRYAQNSDGEPSEDEDNASEDKESSEEEGIDRTWAVVQFAMLERAAPRL